MERRTKSPIGLSGDCFLIDFLHDLIQVVQRFLDGQGIHFASAVLSRLDGPLQVVARNLHRHRVSDDLACALAVLHPGWMGQRNPDWPVVDQEFDIDGIGVAGRDGNNQCLILAVHPPTAPAIDRLKIVIHWLKVYLSE